MRAERVLLSLPALLLAAVLLPGCLEQDVTTTVHPDGSCERLVVIRKDSPGFPEGILPAAVDSSWSRSSARDSGSASNYRWTFKKQFARYEDLSREWNQSAAPGKIRVAVDIQKHFRWVYTYYDYQETYFRFSPFHLIPPSAVMSEDEILRYTYGDTTEGLRKKVDEWEARNLFEMVYIPMVRGAEQRQNPGLVSRLAAHKEEAFRILNAAAKDDHLEDSLLAYSSSSKSKDDLFHDGRITDAGVDALMNLAVRAFGTDSLRQLRGELQEGWRAMEQTLLGTEDPQANSDGFVNTVVMPGIVLETGAPEVKGDALSWKFQKSQLKLHDYEMRAESRVVNIWTLVLTGLLVLGLLSGALAFPAMLRRRHPVLTPTD